MTVGKEPAVRVNAGQLTKIAHVTEKPGAIQSYLLDWLMETKWAKHCIQALKQEVFLVVQTSTVRRSKILFLRRQSFDLLPDNRYQFELDFSDRIG